MRIVYEVPPSSVIDACSRQVCQCLAEEHGPAYVTPEVIDGFANFLKVVASIWVNHLNVVCEANDKVDNQAA